MAKLIKVFKTTDRAQIKGVLVLTENPIDSKNFHLEAKFKFSKDEDFETLFDENFHSMENLRDIHKKVIEGRNKNWELDYVKTIGRA